MTSSAPPVMSVLGEWSNCSAYPCTPECASTASTHCIEIVVEQLGAPTVCDVDTTPDGSPGRSTSTKIGPYAARFALPLPALPTARVEKYQPLASDDGTPK